MKKYKRVTCDDGFSMSVQASVSAYCTPRNDSGPYSEVEVGYPNCRDEMLIQYAENPDRPTETVYGYVPCLTVYMVITAHGGMTEGQVPPGVPVYEHIKWSKE